MADPSGGPPMQLDWRNEAFRRKVIQQIDDAVRLSATQMTKSSIEMENHVFLKAKTRDEYMALVARLILHVKGINQKDKDKKAQMGPAGMGYPQQPQPGMPPGAYKGPNMGPVQQPGMSDPMHALQNLAMQGTTAIPGQQPGMITQQQSQQQQQQRQQLIQQQLLQQQQQHQRNAAAAQAAAQQQQQRPPLQRQDAFIVTSAQNVQVQPVTQQLPASSNTQQQQVTYQYQGPLSSGLQQRPIATSQMQAMSQPGFQQGGLPIQQQQQQQQPPQQQQQQQQQQPIMSQSNISQSMSAVPSPLQQGSQMASSPMSLSMMTSPSPQPGVVPSPASRASAMYGVPSPSSVPLNTPATTAQAVSDEDSAYLEKLSQMSKYVEPLRRMINRRMINRQPDKDDSDRMKEIHKMKNLLEILTDPSKRLPMGTLLKCEQVLLKLEIEWDKSSEKTTPNPDTASKAAPITTHMCQPLLDAVAAQIKSPMLNHSLHRAFGPAITALHGSPIKAPSPPPKKRKKEEEEEEEDIPHILQCEIASLGSRFRVNFDPSQHGCSKDIHLLCRLDDKNLPSVPPIAVKVPESYPDSSPECDTKAIEYESSLFLQTIQQTLAILLLRMPDKFTFTELLDKWEMSVRKACASAV